MSNREKKLIMLMAVAIIAAGTFLLFDRMPPSGAPDMVTTGATLEEVQRQVKEVSAAAKSQGASKSELHLLDAAARPWKSSSMFDSSLAFGARTVKQTELPSYTGFIELGSERLAILSGVEYMTGDLLEGGKYRVLEIEPDHVSLADMSGKGSLTITYEDPSGSAQ